MGELVVLLDQMPSCCVGMKTRPSGITHHPFLVRVASEFTLTSLAKGLLYCPRPSGPKDGRRFFC